MSSLVLRLSLTSLPIPLGTTVDLTSSCLISLYMPRFYNSASSQQSCLMAPTFGAKLITLYRLRRRYKPRQLELTFIGAIKQYFRSTNSLWPI